MDFDYLNSASLFQKLFSPPFFSFDKIVIIYIKIVE